MTYIGIDISKDYFDADMGRRVRRFANTAAGHGAFIAALIPSGHCVMEATGSYGYRLATALHERGIAVSIVNPLQVKRFSQSRLRRAKTDASDAQLLTTYGERYTPPRWQPTPAYIACLKQLRGCMELLTGMQTMIANQQHAFTHLPEYDILVQNTHTQMLESLHAQITALQQRMNDLLHTQCASLYNCVRSVKGIGPKAAAALITVTNAFTTFRSAKHLASYLGVCPQITQSGTSNPGKARLCKLGNASIRKTLYVCSWSAMRCNRACRELYERMCAKGKPKMVALIAVVNKLLRQVMAVVIKHELYNDEYQPKPITIIA